MGAFVIPAQGMPAFVRHACASTKIMNSRIASLFLSRALLCAVMLLLCGTSSHASTILRLEFNQMLEQADLVFEGEVLTSRSQWNQQRSSINTYIDFQVNEVIQGAYAQSVITLRFSGGTVGDTTLQIEGVVYPEPGEKGIYFVLDPTRHFVNPLVSWSQGHFRIRRSGCAGPDLYR